MTLGPVVIGQGVMVLN